MARNRTKIELKQLFTRLKTKGISDAMMHELIDRLWRNNNVYSTGARRMTNLQSHNVKIVFAKTFLEQPVIVQFDVYRYTPRGSAYIKRDVLYTYPDNLQPTKTGIEINIDSREPLAGIIIEYEFKESTT